MNRVRTAVLISGRGSNMVALANAASTPDFPAKIVLVVSNVPSAAGINKAQDLGIETASLDHSEFKDRLAFDKALHECLLDHEIELVCCAGFMRILSPWFTEEWRGRIINIHPSLLPKYKGLHTHKRALKNGDTEHGCTVHFVTPELDAGDPILQTKIEVLPGDTPDTLAERLVPIEHETYVRALEIVAASLQTQK